MSALHTVYDTLPYSMTSSLAPECRDVQWSSLVYSHTERAIRNMIANALTTLLVIFWVIPATAVYAISNLRSLRAQYGFLSWIDSIPVAVLDFIQGYLPAILLALFLILVPVILLAFAQEEGKVSSTELGISLLNKYFAFVMINFFLGQTEQKEKMKEKERTKEKHDRGSGEGE